MGFLPFMNIVHARACHNILNVIFISIDKGNTGKEVYDKKA